jgi:ADP-ribose pyrophosphatase YjhB (NUDIX family)
MRREYPEHPIIGVGGVIFDDDRVLIVKRDKEPGKGQWSLPGGAVKVGETLKDALKREIFEELFIQVEIFGLVRLLDRIIYDNANRVRYHYVIANYWCEMVSGRPRAASDISDARFVGLLEIGGEGLHKEVVETILLAAEKRKRP